MRKPWLIRTLKAKVRKKGDILGTLFTLGELRKDEEPSEPLPRAKTNRLPAHSKTVQIDLGNVASLDLSSSADPFEAEIDKGQDDAAREDPSGNVDGNGRVDFGRPSVEDEKLDGSEGVDSVDGERDDEADPEGDVGEDGTAALGLEVAEVDVVPFLVGVLPDLFAAVSEAAHVGIWLVLLCD